MSLKSIIEKNTRSLRKPFSKITIHDVEFCLTTKCTLKCRKCFQLMPYYLFHPNGIKKAGDFSLEYVEKQIKKFLQTVDLVERFYLIGGEPFIYKDIDYVIKILNDSPKIKNVGVVTNGTIIPNEKVIEVLKNPKVCVSISYYGEISKHKEDLEKIFNENKIPYNIRNCYENEWVWVDPGEIENRGLNEEELTLQYKNCTVPKCQLILDGKIFMCPRCAHMLNLELIPPPSSIEYVDFMKNTKFKSKSQIRKLFEKKYLSACNYCKSINSDVQIKAAEQFSKEEITQLKEINIKDN